MNFQALKIYYFSGTGNSKQAINWVATAFNRRQIPANIVNLSEIRRKKIERPDKDTLVGFCSPTHGFNYPPVMVNFIFRFPKTKHRNPVFLMNTRAGLKMNRLFLPGLSGIALLLAALVLRLKGYRIVGLQSVDLPSNWISLHPGVRMVPIESMFRRLEKITNIFVNNLFTKGYSFRALKSLPFDIAVAPVAILYYLLGRFVLAKTFYASTQTCTRCGICQNQCPVQAIKWVDNRPFWKLTCESYMHCMNVCPERAIETAHGYIFSLFILTSFLLQTFIYKFFGKLFPDLFQSAFAGFFKLILQTAVILLMFTAGYYFVHYLRRVRIINRLMDLTSLTHYKFWRRYFHRVPQKNETN